MSDAVIAKKLDDKAEKPPRPSPVAPPTVTDEKKKLEGDDTDVMEIAPFKSRPFLKSATFYGWQVNLTPEMQIRPRDVPFIEKFIPYILTRAFMAWVVFRRLQNDRKSNKPRKFSEFYRIISRVVAEERVFAGTPGRLAFVLDSIDSTVDFLMECAAKEQKVQPPASPTVPSITFMQYALLKSGVDTTFETTEIDVEVDDIKDANWPFKPHPKPMAIFTGKGGPDGQRERQERDNERRKRFREEDDAVRAERAALAKRPRPG